MPRLASQTYRVSFTRHPDLPRFAQLASQTYRIYMCSSVEKPSPASQTYRVLRVPPAIPTDSSCG
jgi:hypothetical protein